MHGENYGEDHGAPIVTGNQLNAVGSQLTCRGPIGKTREAKVAVESPRM